MTNNVLVLYKNSVPDLLTNDIINMPNTDIKSFFMIYHLEIMWAVIEDCP